jgi:hypothetical protein
VVEEVIHFTKMKKTGGKEDKIKLPRTCHELPNFSS